MLCKSMEVDNFAKVFNENISINAEFYGQKI